MSKQELNVDSIKKIQALMATLSSEDLKALKKTGLPKIKKSVTKWNKSGGIYFISPDMVSTSKDGKEYNSGINIHAHQVKPFLAMLRNPELIEDIIHTIVTGQEVERDFVQN